jgi:hypothetical protein
MVTVFLIMLPQSSGITSGYWVTSKAVLAELMSTRKKGNRKARKRTKRHHFCDK